MIIVRMSPKLDKLLVEIGIMTGRATSLSMSHLNLADIIPVIYHQEF